METGAQHNGMERRVSQKAVNFPAKPDEIDREFLAQPKAEATDDSDNGGQEQARPYAQTEEYKGSGAHSANLNGQADAESKGFEESVKRIQSERDAQTMIYGGKSQITGAVQEHQNLVQRSVTSNLESKSAVIPD